MYSPINSQINGEKLKQNHHSSGIELANELELVLAVVFSRSFTTRVASSSVYHGKYCTASQD